MTQDPNGGDDDTTLYERWQAEQRSWQQMITGYVDRAATDENFLINLGNAMRGSLLANKPYPGSTNAATGVPEAVRESSELDEVVFAVRRLEGKVSELITAIDQLADDLVSASGSGPGNATASDAGTRDGVSAKEHPSTSGTTSAATGE